MEVEDDWAIQLELADKILINSLIDKVVARALAAIK
jgi:hypothetical protein